MKFDITYTYREHWFSVGIERTSGRHFLAFPVSVGAADYMEYYSITPADYHSYVADQTTALAFAEECRSRLHDDLLFIPPPPTNRGTAR